MKKCIISALALMALLSCGRYSLTVTDEVINAGLFGNGVEWDPYDEALSWGSEVSDADWEKLYERMDFMKPQYVRCMINSPYLYYDGGRFRPERNSRNILKLLSFCQSRGVSVVYGEFNPPDWSLKGSDEWVRMSVAYLDWLVSENGFTCIRNFVIFNEPDGNWASTDGDFGFWASMYRRFEEEMRKYPALASVELAGPDAVLNYRNPASEYDSYGWVEQTAASLDAITGLYDVHCYPGQDYVRSGRFADDVARIKALIPQGKRFIFGEGGYKYYDPADSLLLAEYRRRAGAHPFTRGSDCNMLVPDYFYALDMPVFAMEAMNNGASGVAAWMLDDAMHSNGDSGRPEDVKIWGMWNILGAEVFGDESLETPRPWFYTWSMLCRCFPSGADVLKVESDLPSGVYASASRNAAGEYALALVNVNDAAYRVNVSLPVGAGAESGRTDALLAVFTREVGTEEGTEKGCLVQTSLAISGGRRLELEIPAESFVAVSTFSDF